LDVWRQPLWTRPAFGGLITWILGCSVFIYTGHLGVFGLGYEDLSAGLNHDLAWEIAGVLLIAKFVATVCCYGFGGCGGIFSPCLFFGGMCGLALAGTGDLFLDLNSADHVVMGVVGMSACLGAVVRAPVTGILIVFEMTHDFSLVPALMLGALVSQAISRKLCAENFYDALLRQDGHVLHKVIPPRDLKGWRQLPVSAIATFQPAVVNDMNPEVLKELLRKNPYERFPVVLNGNLEGVITRREVELSLSEKRAARLQPPITCLRNETIGDLQNRLIESSTLVVILLDQPKGKVIGLVTLHDLLRAESDAAERSME
jgi:CIC family chloride channel protein